MHSEEPQSTPPPTEGQTVPPEEQIIPTAGLVQEDEQTQGDQGDQQDQGKAEGMADKVKEAAPESVGAAAGQAQSLARANPMPIGLAVAFVAGVVVGRIASRR